MDPPSVSNRAEDIMQCDDASRALHAGEKSGDLEIHLSACEECRALSDDLAQLGRAFARARTAWLPGPGFRVRLPAAPWRKLAIAAGLLVLPLVGWAAALVAAPRAPSHDVGFLLRSPARETPSSDRQTLTTMFLPENQP
jgi:predicted anti-sigma-YlaC factor YlaD